MTATASFSWCARHQSVVALSQSIQNCKLSQSSSGIRWVRKTSSQATASESMLKQMNLKFRSQWHSWTGETHRTGSSKLWSDRARVFTSAKIQLLSDCGFEERHKLPQRGPGRSSHWFCNSSNFVIITKFFNVAKVTQKCYSVEISEIFTSNHLQKMWMFWLD